MILLPSSWQNRHLQKRASTGPHPTLPSGTMDERAVLPPEANTPICILHPMPFCLLKESTPTVISSPSFKRSEPPLASTRSWQRPIPLFPFAAWKNGISLLPSFPLFLCLLIVVEKSSKASIQWQGNRKWTRKGRRDKDKVSASHAVTGSLSL